VGRRLPAPGRGLVWRAVLRQNGTLTLVRHLGSPLHHGSDSSSIDAKRHEKLSNGYNNERPDAPRGRPMPDAPLTPHEFRIELGDLRAAIGVVQRERAAISASVQLVKTEFGKASEAWNTPAAAGYEDVRLWLDRATADLESLLAEMGRRLQRAYENYAQAEEKNARNLSGR